MIAIELSLQQLKDAVKQLTPAEKMELNDEIWKDGFIIPQEHKALVRERIAGAKADPGLMLDWDVASKTL